MPQPDHYPILRPGSRMHPIIVEDIQRITSSAQVDWDRLRGKTIVITGANGFLPAYMVETILFLNRHVFAAGDRAKVIGIVRNGPRAKARFRDHGQREDLIFLIQDATLPIAIPGPVDVVIHAASPASPKHYGTDPVGTILTNVLGCHSTLELAKANRSTYLFFSSGEVYGEVQKQLITEVDYGFLDPTKVRSCYGEGKRAGETMCVSYAYQYGIDAKIIRPFHTYGPGMALDDGRVFADFVADVVNGRDIQLKSQGTAIRPFCYLADAVAGFFTVLLHGRSGEAYNVANPQQKCSVRELAHVLAGLFPERKLAVKSSHGAVTAGYLTSPVLECSPDIAKINALGWHPTTVIPDGFRRTIESFGERP